MSYKVVYTDHRFDTLDVERKIFRDVDATLVDGEAEEIPIADLVIDADAVAVMHFSLNAALIEQMRDCRVIARTGIGVDNVNVEAATRQGIYVANVPDYCIQEVSDHVLANVLVLNRQLVQYNQSVKEGRWVIDDSLAPNRLEEQTLGLIAFGNIAQEVCRKARGFGMEVLAFDPYQPDDEIEAHGAEPIDDLDELLTTSDVVSIHTPLTEETENLIGSDQLSKMDESSILVNCSRGGIVDESALVEALGRGEIAGVGLDVLADEPLDPDDPLLAFDQVIITPHMAWYSSESERELREKTARNLKAVLMDSRPKYVVNDDVR